MQIYASCSILCIATVALSTCLLCKTAEATFITRKQLPPCCSLSATRLVCTNCGFKGIPQLDPDLQLTALNLDGDSISSLPGGVFVNVSRTLKEFVLRSRTHLLGSSEVGALAELKVLTNLTLEAAEEDNDKTMSLKKLLTKLRVLRNLRLTGIRIELDMTGLSVNLESLALTRAQLHDLQEGAFAELAQSLRHLDLAGNTNLMLENPHWLNRLNNLETLSLANTGIGKQLKLPKLPNLRHLNLSGNTYMPRLSEGSLSAVAQSLEELDLSASDLLSNQQCFGLRGLGRLRWLRMSSLRQLNYLPPQLANLSELRHLDLSKTDLAGINANNFPRDSKLEALLLTETQLSMVEATAFEPLKRSLRRLEVSGPYLGSVRMVNGNDSLPGAWELVLKWLPNLTDLQLSSDPPANCNDSSSSFRGLKDSLWMALRHLKQLQRLILDGNCIRHVAPDLLPKNLQLLSLAKNPIVCFCSPPLAQPSEAGALILVGVTCAEPPSVAGSTLEQALDVTSFCPKIAILNSRIQPILLPLLITAGFIALVIIVPGAIITSVLRRRQRQTANAAAATAAFVASHNQQVAGSAQPTEEEEDYAYAQYERPITCSLSAGNAYEELVLPTMLEKSASSPVAVKTTLKSRRFFRKCDDRGVGVLQNHQQLQPLPPPPPLTPLPPVPPPSPTVAGWPSPPSRVGCNQMPLTIPNVDEVKRIASDVPSQMFEKAKTPEILGVADASSGAADVPKNSEVPKSPEASNAVPDMPNGAEKPPPNGPRAATTTNETQGAANASASSESGVDNAAFQGDEDSDSETVNLGHF